MIVVVVEKTNRCWVLAECFKLLTIQIANFYFAIQDMAWITDHLRNVLFWTIWIRNCLLFRSPLYLQNTNTKKIYSLITGYVFESAGYCIFLLLFSALQIIMSSFLRLSFATVCNTFFLQSTLLRDCSLCWDQTYANTS